MTMMAAVKKDFPSLFTKSGNVLKRAPKKFECTHCGFLFNKTQKLNLPGVGFAIPFCEMCGRKGKKYQLYTIWDRLQHSQIEMEEFVLETVIANPSIQIEHLRKLIRDKFEDEQIHAIGQLAYYGYLNIDKEKRDKHGIVEYTVNDQKDLARRYEQRV